MCHDFQISVHSSTVEPVLFAPIYFAENAQKGQFDFVPPPAVPPDAARAVVQRGQRQEQVHGRAAAEVRDRQVYQARGGDAGHRQGAVRAAWGLAILR